MTEFEKKKLFWIRLGALAAAGVLLLTLALGTAVIFTLGPLAGQSSDILRSLDAVTEELESVDWESTSEAVNNLSAQLKDVELEEIIRRLDEVSADLAAIDWVGLSEELQELGVDCQESLVKAQEGLDRAMQSIDQLDIQGLNEAIADLRAVIEPLADLTGRFR